MAGSLILNNQYFQTGDPTTVHEASAVLYNLGSLGHVVTVSNSTLFSPGLAPRIYQFIQRSSSDNTTHASPGSAAFWKSYDNFVVTSKASDAYDATAFNHVAGVFPGILVAAGEYGYIQVGGQGPLLLKGAPTSAADTSGKPIVAETGVDLTFDCVASYGAAAQVVAKALTAKNAGSIGTNVVEALLFPSRHSW